MTIEDDAQPRNRPERQTALPFGSRRALRAGARSLQTFGIMKSYVPDTHEDIAMLGIDTMLMLDDLRSFLDFSEQNIQWQKKRELHRVQRECDKKLLENPDLGPTYSESHCEDVQRRFDSLVQRVRYASLIALITTVERVAVAMRGFAESMDRSLPPRPSGKNIVVHLLDVFSQVGLGSEQQVVLLETLTQVRNCIVHAAGLIDEYEHGAQLRSKLTDFDGIRVSLHDFWGQDTIEIDEGYLQRLLDDTKAWLVKLYR